MDFSLSLSGLTDNLLTMSLRIVLTILSKILFVVKGEDVTVTKIEVTIKKENEEKQYIHILDANKIPKERSIDPKGLINEQKETKKEPNLITGTPSEWKSEEINKDDDKSENSSEFHEIPHLEIARSFEMKTSYNNYYNNNNNNESDILPIEFNWQHGGQEVIITGDFDDWQGSHKMNFNPVTKEFVAVINIDRTKQHEFKFIIDGDWRPNWDLPTRTDEHGIVNNIIYAVPSGPLSPEYKEYSSSFAQLTAAY